MVEIRLFGTTTFTTPLARGGAAQLGGVKPRQILEILALAAGTPVPKEQLADLLWEGRPPRSYVGTLESYVCVLRRRMGLVGRASAISTTTQGYLLDPGMARVDVAEFRAAVRPAATASPAAALGRLEEGIALVRGELLASETYATWAIRERTIVQREIVGAAVLAAGHALALEQFAVAVRMARLATQRDALAEQGWLLLMRGLWASGQRSDALRAYFELRDALAAELGTDPSPASQGLYLEILRDERGAERSRTDGRDEVRMLMRLLRQAVESIPGLDAPGNDLALAQVAARLIQVA